MKYLGFTKIQDGISRNDEELQKFAKTLVLADFARKLAVYSTETVMIPYSLVLYDIIYERFGFNLNDFNEEQLNQCTNHLEGLQIETEEIISLTNLYINGSNNVDYSDKIREWFAKGEFPFVITNIYRYEDYDIVTYYLTR